MLKLEPVIWHKEAMYHPYFKETWEYILNFIKRRRSKKRAIRVLEYGAGTGHLTLGLAEMSKVDITALEKEARFFRVLKKNLVGQEINIIQGDSITYKNLGKFDFIASSVFHHHIPDPWKITCLNNAFLNLKPGGYYIIGDEFIPKYNSDQERKDKLKIWYDHVLSGIKKHRKWGLFKLECRYLDAEYNRRGEYKISPELFEKSVQQTKFKIFKKKKIGPKEDIGGLYVYVLRKGRSRK